MRSLARDFSSSRRAPPKAASKPCGAKPVEQRLSLEQAAAALGIERDGIGSGGDGRFIAPNQQFRADRPRHLVAEGDHLAEFESGIDVKQGKGDGPWIKGLLRQAQHDGRILADGVEHHRVFEFGGHFAEDVNAFSFEQSKVAEARSAARARGIRREGTR